MWTFSTCRNLTGCEGCRLKACCPIVLDRRLHAIEKARQEEIAREREWFAHGTILDLNSSSAHLQRDGKMMNAREIQSGGLIVRGITALQDAHLQRLTEGETFNAQEDG